MNLQLTFFLYSITMPATTRSTSIPDISKEAEISITQRELDEMVEEAVKTATKLFQKKLDQVNARLNQQMKENKMLRSHINRLEQYSRRSHLRIYGLPVGREEDCKEAVATFLSNNLKKKDNTPIKVSRSDIDAAHPLPNKAKVPIPSRNPSASGSLQASNHPAIIVRFFSRELRDACMVSRRSLKDSRYSLQDDLTRANVNLMKELKGCPNVEKVWSWTGKIFALLKGQSRGKIFDIIDKLPQ